MRRGVVLSFDGELPIASALGIRAVPAEPGFTKTKFEANGRLASASLEAYAPAKRRVEAMFRAQFADSAEPGDVARLILRAATDPNPKLRYRMPGGATMSRLRRFAPERLFAWGLRRRLRLDNDG